MRVIINCIILLLLGGITPKGYALESKNIDISYKVAIDKPSESRIDVTAVFSKSPGTDLELCEENLSQYLNVSGLKATDEQGTRLAVNTLVLSVPGPERMHEKRVYTILSRTAKAVNLEYSVKPGAIGKHGHRGYLDERFGLMSGNTIFLYPKARGKVRKISVAFRLPGGWEAVCPWKKEGDNFVVEKGADQYNLYLRDILCEAVIGFGNFQVCSRQINGFNIHIYAFSKWPQEHIKSISEQSFRLIKYQLDLFGIDQKWEYSILYVPSANDKKRVFGGVWSLGQGFEMETPSNRSWELLSHRFHHLFDFYFPFGMYMADRSSQWFFEATASYYEVKALAAMGYYKLEERISRLKSDYDSRKPKYDAPLSSDYKQKFGTVEFLHYKKGPLVAYLLDEKIKAVTKGTKDLDQFLKFLYARHGMKSSPIKLEEELEQFSGTSFGAFFKKYVNGIEPIALKGEFLFPWMKRLLQ